MSDMRNQGLSPVQEPRPRESDKPPEYGFGSWTNLNEKLRNLKLFNQQIDPGKPIAPTPMSDKPSSLENR